MQNDLMKKTTVLCSLFVAVAMGIMLHYCANKIAVVADLAQDEVVQAAEGRPEHGAVEDGNRIVIDRNSGKTNYFCVPVPPDVRVEEVTVENHYMDRELWVSIEPEKMSGQESFYESNGVYGSCEAGGGGNFEGERKRICLRFKLTDVFEYRSIFEDNTLYIEFVPPKEVYEKIVVIDPAYGKEDTGVVTDDIAAKDITLNIAKALKAKLDETDIKVYYTRMDDSNPEAEYRVRLAEDTKADMLIRIEVGSDKSSKKYGTETVYNSQFFIPGFGSVELADLLEREVVTAISGKAGGLLEAEQTDTVISEATVPAAAVKVGYLTNGQEAILLQREDYIQRIAEGIYQAVLKAYER